MQIPLVKFPIQFPTLGWQVIDWIETYLVHGPGDVQSESIKLDLEECAFLCWAYRLNPDTGRRLVHRGIYCRGKGQRKSEFGGMICCAEALGPVRFDGWDANHDPVGKSVTYPFVRVMATEESQSSNVWDNVSYMLSNGEVQNAYEVDVGRSFQTSTRIFIKSASGGQLVPSTSGDASKDGGKESFVCADESHLMSSNKLRGMYRTVARNTGKRKDAEPWLSEFTTAWQPGENSIVEQASKYLEMDYEEAIGKHGVLFDMKSGNPPRIFGQDASLAKAITSAYAPYKNSWTDIPKVVRLVRDAEDPETECFRYYLNIPRAGSAQWLYPNEIDKVLGEVHVEQGEMVALGFDGSMSDDHTVLMGCKEDGDIFTVGYWTPQPGDERWREEVDEAVHWCFDNFKVVRFYADPPFFTSELNGWARKYGSPPIHEWWTNIDGKMAAATGALRTAIRKEEDRITIDPAPLKTAEQHRDGKTLVSWHLANARTRKVKVRLDDKAEEAFVIRKERAGSALKIDTAVASVLARRARDDAIKLNAFEVTVFSRAAW